MNQHIPGNHLVKIMITLKTLFNRVKIIDMSIYHRSPLNVNTFYQNFTILFFILYYGKAIKRESGKVENA
jgi:hypothetical protein